MKNKLIFQNIPRLEDYIGGFHSSDSLLFITSKEYGIDVVIESLITDCVVNKLPLFYISVIGTYNACIANIKNSQIIDYSLKGSSTQQKLKSINRTLAKSGKNGCIVIDDLSFFNSHLKGEKQLISFYENILEYSRKNNSIVITSVDRSCVDITTIAKLKDMSSVVLDVYRHEGSLYCNALNLKNRYTPLRLSPLKLDINELKKPGRAQVGEESSAIAISENIQRDLKSPFSPDVIFQKSFQNATEAMLIFEYGGSFREPNRKLSELLGYTSDELKIRNLSDYFIPSQKFSALRFYTQLKTKKYLSFKSVIKTKSGKYLPIDISVSNLSKGLFLAIIKNQREQVETEKLLHEESKKYLKILESSQFAAILFENNKPIYANSKFTSLIGYNTPTKWQECKINDLFDSSGSRLIRSIIKKVISTDESVTNEITILKTDKSTIECQITVLPVKLGKKILIGFTILDISSQKDFIKRLQNSETKFRSLIEESPLAISLSKDEKYTFCNKSFIKLFAFEKNDQVVGFDKSIIRLKKDSAKEKPVSGKKPRQLISTVRANATKHDGSYVQIEISKSQLTVSGEVIDIEFYRDVTSDAKSEIELKNRKKELSLIEKITHETSKSLDLQHISEVSLKTLVSSLGWEKGCVYIKDDSDEFSIVSHEGVSDNLIKKIGKMNASESIGGYLSKTLEPAVIRTASYPSFLPHKSTFKNENAASICLIPLIANNEINGIIILISSKEVETDEFVIRMLSSIGNQIGGAISNGKAYTKIVELKNRYDSLFSSISDVVYSGTSDEHFKFVSPNVENLLNYNPKDFNRNKSLWLSLVHPDDKKVVMRRNINLNSLTKNSIIEYRVLPKGKAEYIWLRDSVSIGRDEQGTIESVSGIISDINDQKNLETTLRNAEQFKSGILGGVREGVIVFDRNFNFVEWNEAIERITGWSRTDILGKNIREITNDLFGKDIEHYLNMALEGKVVSSDDIYFNIPDTKKEGYLWAKHAPLQSSGGEILGVVTIVSDITRRKKLEEEIKNSEQILRNVIDAMGDLFILTDLRGKVIEVNREFVNALGYSRSEALGREFPYPWLIEEEMSRYVIWISNLRSKNFLYDFDMTWQTKDGKNLSVSLSTTLLRNPYGESIAMLNLGRDITDRQKMASDLAERNKHIEAINDIIQTANKTTDFEKIFRVFAENIYGFLSFDLIEICLKSDNPDEVEVFAQLNKQNNSYSSKILKKYENCISKIALSEQKAICISDTSIDEKFIIHNLVEDEYGSIISFPLISKAEVVGTINLYSAAANAYSEEHLLKIKPFVDQIGSIIDRILLFQKVSDDASYIHNLLNSIDSVVFTVDTEFRIKEVNKAWYDFVKKKYRKSKKSFEGNHLFDILTDQMFQEKYRAIAQEVLRGNLKFVSKEYEEITSDGRSNYNLTINPMVIGDRITGLVFTQTDITELKRTEEELKKRNEQLLDLSDISTEISASYNLTEILETSLPRLQRVINADSILLFLKDQQGDELVLKKQVGIKGEPNYQLKIPVSKYNTGKVFGQVAPVFIKDNVIENKEVHPSLKNLLSANEVSAMAGIPLKSGDKIIGVINIYFKQAHDFNVQEHQLLSLIGNQLGSAIENALLYAELKSQLDRLNILYELSQQLTATLDIDQVLDAVFTQLLRILKFNEFYIHFIDDSRMTQTTLLHIRSVNGEHVYLPKIIQPIQIAEVSPLWKVITDKRTIVEKSTVNDIIYTFVPMAVKNNVVGSIVLGSDKEPYSEAETKLLESICGLTAIALEKTKLYEDVVQKSLEIQRRNKELDDFTYVVSHDLKEPLISIECYSKILLEEYNAMLQSEGGEYLHSIVQASARMKCLIDDLLTLSRISRISESFKPIDIESLLEEIKLDLSYTIQMKNVILVVQDSLPKVFGNETQMKVLFRNLISNAIKFNNKPNPTIEIGYEIFGRERYKYFVKDNGIGIDEKYFEKIFVIFQRLHSRDEFEGTGAGLAIVKKIIEMHRGNIWVESNLGEGTTFNFTLLKVNEEL